jgi:hypothetical protein
MQEATFMRAYLADSGKAVETLRDKLEETFLQHSLGAAMQSQAARNQSRRVRRRRSRYNLVLKQSPKTGNGNTSFMVHPEGEGSGRHQSSRCIGRFGFVRVISSQ